MTSWRLTTKSKSQPRLEAYVFKLRAKLNAPSLNYTSYVQQLEDSARANLGRGILEYLVTFQAIVPVWSGASHATLTTLAQFISAPLAIQPVQNAYDRRGYGASQGDAYLDFDNGIYTFAFQTTLPHLNYNERINANINPDPTLRGKLLQPGPYGFVDATNQKVRTVLRSFEPPNLSSHIRSKKVR